MRTFFLVFLIAVFLAGCGGQISETSPSAPTQTIPSPTVTAPAETTQPAVMDPVESLLNSMTVEERVGQVFLARCNAETAPEDIKAYHLGGLILFSQDFEGETPDSLRQKIQEYQLFKC